MIHDIRMPCTFENKLIVFDTNVWINIYGPNPGNRSPSYSNYLKDLKGKGNKIVLPDVVLGEFYNRTIKIDYQIFYDDDPKFQKFKSRRKSEEFKDYMESARDTCLHILADSIYSPTFNEQMAISECIEELTHGHIDYTDIILREFCISNSYIFVTDDADFRHDQLQIVTGNPRLLRSKK